ncbi:hypothetical protein [Paraburkholderia metrosideri]|uniref:Uncharacterized protein n=1 Tax=Paraburkholderia metrosideri TaxID=580937 RepID=A0ABM8NNX4_9BURK|nr:hypothetical protein [Paraburkholderia metrosideri]CAD6535714.1 hypothetical protein LMG28140_02960 [Paraburkholderia metrosideri]
MVAAIPETFRPDRCRSAAVHANDATNPHIRNAARKAGEPAVTDVTVITSVKRVATTPVSPRTDDTPPHAVRRFAS